MEAAQQVNASHIFVLPNNKNIILAAQQAADLLEDKTLHVIPTKSVPQGITAMISFIQGESPQFNEEAMVQSLTTVVSALLRMPFGIRIWENLRFSKAMYWR